MFSGGIEIEQWHETDKFKKTATNHRHLLHNYHCSFKLSKKTNISHPLIRTSKCEKKTLAHSFLDISEHLHINQSLKVLFWMNCGFPLTTEAGMFEDIVH